MKQYEWYDELTHTGVIVINGYRNSRPKTLDDLEEVGCKILEKIEFPVDLADLHYYHVRFPPKLVLKRDEDNDSPVEIFDYVDTKGMPRIRVWQSGYMSGTNVFRRYHARDQLPEDIGHCCACVIDNEKVEQDLDYDDGSAVIWKGERVSLNDEPLISLQKKAEAWLDQNYPQWRDPSAYWTAP